MANYSPTPRSYIIIIKLIDHKYSPQTEPPLKLVVQNVLRIVVEVCDEDDLDNGCHCLNNNVANKRIIVPYVLVHVFVFKCNGP